MKRISPLCKRVRHLTNPYKSSPLSFVKHARDPLFDLHNLAGSSFSKLRWTSINQEVANTMVSSLNLAVLVTASTFVVGISTPLRLPSGIFYTPERHLDITDTAVAEDLSLVAQHFSSIRTYSSRFDGMSAIAMAYSANLKIAVGVSLDVPWLVVDEINAVCEGVAKYPTTVEAVYVGNEILESGNIGMLTADEIIVHINKVKQCVGGKVPVGTVLRINEWLQADTAEALANACDLVGSNIYPFFTLTSDSPINKLNYQWGEMVAKFGPEKVRLTKTSWPHKGQDYHDNVPSTETMQQFFDDYRTKWSSNSKNQSYWFMAFDSAEWSAAGYEMYSGVFDLDRSPNIQLPVMS